MAKKILKKAQNGDALRQDRDALDKYEREQYIARQKKRAIDEAPEIAKRALTSISDKIGKTSLKGSLSEYEKMYAPKKKMGGMIKRADGSYSKRGLWDNIRANKGSGKKPTAAMLKQEKKIKAQTKKK
jgi:hypothetical protein